MANEEATNTNELKTWTDYDERCRELLGFSATQIATGVICDWHAKNPEIEHDEPAAYIDAVADVIGSSGDNNARAAAALVLAALRKAEAAAAGPSAAARLAEMVGALAAPLHPPDPQDPEMDLEAVLRWCVSALKTMSAGWQDRRLLEQDLRRVHARHVLAFLPDEALARCNTALLREPKNVVLSSRNPAVIDMIWLDPALVAEEILWRHATGTLSEIDVFTYDGKRLFPIPSEVVTEGSEIDPDASDDERVFVYFEHEDEEAQRAALATARRYLDAVEGTHTGNRHTLIHEKVAPIGLDHRVNLEHWLPEVLVWNDERVKPPLPMDEVTEIVLQAYRMRPVSVTWIPFRWASYAEVRAYAEKPTLAVAEEEPAPEAEPDPESEPEPDSESESESEAEPEDESHHGE